MWRYYEVLNFGKKYIILSSFVDCRAIFETHYQKAVDDIDTQRLVLKVFQKF